MQGGGALIYGSASFINCNVFDNEAPTVRARVSDLLPSPRKSISRLIYFCMQCGGVFIEDGGHADFSNCALYGNEASRVRARTLELLEPSSSAPLERYATCLLYTSDAADD